MTDPTPSPPPGTESQTALPPEKAWRLMRAATYASVAVALMLIGVKLWAWLQTDSVSLLSTLVDSLLDAGASIINMFAVWHATQPADREHRFGHGKAEALAGLGQTTFILGSVVFLALQAGERLFHSRPVTNPDIGIMVVVFTIFVTMCLVVFQKYVVRRTGSLAIGADSLHYQSDLLLNASVILALVISTQFEWPAADPLFALLVAGFIVWGAWKIVTDAIDVLMDRELPDEDRRRIRDIAMAHEGVESVHDMRTRSAGTHIFVQLHLEMDGDMPLRDAHAIGDTVMYAVEDAFPNAEVLIHQDPAGEEEAPAAFR